MDMLKNEEEAGASRVWEVKEGEVVIGDVGG